MKERRLKRIKITDTLIKSWLMGNDFRYKTNVPADAEIKGAMFNYNEWLWEVVIYSGEFEEIQEGVEIPLFDVVSQRIPFVMPLGLEKSIREEGFDDGKDLAQLLYLKREKGLKPEQTKRMKELKVKYDIPEL